MEGPKQKRSSVGRKYEERKLNKKEDDVSAKPKSNKADRWKEVRSSITELATYDSGMLQNKIEIYFSDLKFKSFNISHIHICDY